MTTAMHTPGPWTYKKKVKRGILYVYAPDGYPVARAMADRQEGEANALLIAAAPDAYAACTELINGDGSSESLQRAISLASIALGIDKRQDPSNSSIVR